MCPRYRKDVKSTSSLTNHVNVYKIPIILPSRQLSNPKLVLDYNITNLLELLSDNNKGDINSGASNNSKKGIGLTDMDSNKEDIR